MIVKPSFLDHWKTKMLITLTGDPAAMSMILRLWSHCEERKRWVFQGMSDYALKAICGWPGAAEELKPILMESGWLDRHETDVIVHEWEVYNASLIQSWNVGKLGGRPKKTRSEPGDNPPVLPGFIGSAENEDAPSQNGSSETRHEPEDNPAETRRFPINPEETQEEPAQNPPVTDGIPGDNPAANPKITRSEPIREDKRREEKKQTDGVFASGSPDQIKDQADLVYLAYPKKVAKPDALKAIVKALKLLPFEELRNRTKDYARAVEGMDPQFIPYPATWFNDQRYNDDPSTWNPVAKKAHAPNRVTGI